jgi:hypothetical protein
MNNAVNELSSGKREVINDQLIEQEWARIAFEFAETHSKVLSCVPDPSQIRLIKNADEVYEDFRKTFPNLEVAVVEEAVLKTEEVKPIWREFSERYKNSVKDYNFGTLLRRDCQGEYDSENTFIVVRIIFYAIEIARQKEGCYSSKIQK